MATKGSALISALFIMTLIAIATTAMSVRLQLDIYRTRLILNQDKLFLASQAVTFWAMDKLAAPHSSFTTANATATVRQFPNALLHLYPEVTLNGRLIDLQARFNLNNLTDKQFQPYFYGLLENTVQNITAFERNSIVKATLNWISPFQPSQGKNELLDFYTKQKPPYWPGYQLMQQVSEFRLIANVTPKLYLSLEPYVTALPEITPININTASKAMLKPLGNGLNQAQVDELIAARGEKGIKDLNSIRAILQKLSIPVAEITLESQYFLCVATASTSELKLTRYTILKRSKDKNGKLSIAMISESINAR